MLSFDHFRLQVAPVLHAKLVCTAQRLLQGKKKEAEAMHSAFCPCISLPRHSQARSSCHLGQPRPSMAVRLGQTNTYISPIGVGTLAWGDVSKGYGKAFIKADVSAASKFLLENGVNFFDCAEVRGQAARIS